MCSGVPRDNSNPSMVFLALSKAVPVLLKKGPKSAEQATEPTKTAPNAFIPKAKPIASGTSTLIALGRIISRKALRVAMSIQ